MAPNFVDPLGIVHINIKPGHWLNVALCEARERGDKWSSGQLQPSYDKPTCMECVMYLGADLTS